MKSTLGYSAAEHGKKKDMKGYTTPVAKCVVQQMQCSLHFFPFHHARQQGSLWCFLSTPCFHTFYRSLHRFNFHRKLFTLGFLHFFVCFGNKTLSCKLRLARQQTIPSKQQGMLCTHVVQSKDVTLFTHTCTEQLLTKQHTYPPSLHYVRSQVGTS